MAKAVSSITPLTEEKDLEHAALLLEWSRCLDTEKISWEKFLENRNTEGG